MLDKTVIGHTLQLERPRRIVQRWRPTDWPEGHSSLAAFWERLWRALSAHLKPHERI